MNKTIDRCYICNGKSRNLCPAAGKVICSVCCGSKRGTVIRCAPGCAYSPFSINGYDLWLKTDTNLVRKILMYAIDARGRSHFEKITNDMFFKNANDSPEQIEATAAGSAIYNILFLERDKHGKTLAQHWKSSGWNGLTNDERVMMTCRMDSRVTVFEIQKILDNKAMECVDLFDIPKGVFILIDRSIAARVARFTRLFTWLTHYPNFSRPENSGIEIPDFIFQEFMDMTQKSFKKALKKSRGFTIKDYLSENVGAFCELAFNLARDTNVGMLKRMDMHQCKAFYKIEGIFAEVKAIVDSYPDFQVRERNPEEKPLEGAFYYSWLRRGESKALEEEMNAAFRHDDESHGVGTIGNLTLCPDKIIIEVFSKQKFEFAKKMIDNYFKEAVTLQNEMVVDLAKQMAEKIDDEGSLRDEVFSEDPNTRSGPIPAEIERKLAQDFYRNHYGKFIDDQIPALNNMTPRQAAKDPAMRPKLVDLMKQHLKGIEKQNKDKKMDLNIGWILDELKLAELK